MAEDNLLRESQGGVLTLTLNRPKANAFDDNLIAALQNALKDAKRDEAVRCVLLQARGKFFSAGQDVGAFGGQQEVSFRFHLLKNYNPLIKQIRYLEKPVVVAINGATAGAALGIVMACDLRIASNAARFFVGFGGIGLAPDSAVSLLLPSLIGLGRATQAAFFNEPISAQQALDWGLVNTVVTADELEKTAQDWSARLAAGPITAMGLTKRDFNKAMIPHLEVVLDYEAHNQDVAGRSGDHREGLEAFIEKRDPDYLAPSTK